MEEYQPNDPRVITLTPPESPGSRRTRYAQGLVAGVTVGALVSVGINIAYDHARETPAAVATAQLPKAPTVELSPSQNPIPTPEASLAPAEHRLFSASRTTKIMIMGDSISSGGYADAE